MAEKGVLEASQMAGTFDILRANDLIFSYVVSNWLMGQDPPAFDILAWNGDSTRMPSAMHSFYLRSLYMRNELAQGDLELLGQQLSLSSVKNDTYVVGAINDHIVPWHGSYKTVGLMGGNVRYVLSSGGHIAGIVNPPGPKAWHEATGDDTAAVPDPEAWRRSGTKQTGSWWEDWTAWSESRAGELIKPPHMGSRKHPAIADAPGEYVFG
jgi:poly[(R)-3-hydroxyalkanoate] polymerase subunit PhaC